MRTARRQYKPHGARQSFVVGRMHSFSGVCGLQLSRRDLLSVRHPPTTPTYTSLLLCQPMPGLRVLLRKRSLFLPLSLSLSLSRWQNIQTNWV